MKLQYNKEQQLNKFILTVSNQLSFSQITENCNNSQRVYNINTIFGLKYTIKSKNKIKYKQLFRIKYTIELL